MHYRIIDLTTDEVIIPEVGNSFIMFDDGSIGQENYDGQNFKGCEKPYVVEFAFQTDDHGAWIYAHSVVHA